MGTMTEYYENEIDRLKGELHKEKEHEKNLKLCSEIYDLYRCYVEVGFTEEQAWEIFIAQVKTANK